MIGDTRPLLETWLHFLDIGYGQEQNHQNTTLADKPSYQHLDPNRLQGKPLHRLTPLETKVSWQCPLCAMYFIQALRKSTSVSNDCPGEFIHITPQEKYPSNRAEGLQGHQFP